MTTTPIHIPTAALVPLAILLVVGGLSAFNNAVWLISGWLDRRGVRRDIEDELRRREVTPDWADDITTVTAIETRGEPR